MNVTVEWYCPEVVQLIRQTVLSNRTAIARNIHDTSTLGIRLGPIYRNLSKDDRPCSSCTQRPQFPYLFGGVSSNRGPQSIVDQQEPIILWANGSQSIQGSLRRKKAFHFINVHLHLIP